MSFLNCVLPVSEEASVLARSFCLVILPSRVFVGTLKLGYSANKCIVSHHSKYLWKWWIDTKVLNVCFDILFSVIHFQ